MSDNSGTTRLEFKRKASGFTKYQHPFPLPPPRLPWGSGVRMDLNSRGSVSVWFCIKLPDKDSTFEVRYRTHLPMCLHFELLKYSIA
jgi:hypothetical protein